MASSDREIRNLVADMAARLEIETAPAPRPKAEPDAADPAAIARAVQRTVGLSGRGLGPDRWSRMTAFARLAPSDYEGGVAQATLAALARKHGEAGQRGRAPQEKGRHGFRLDLKRARPEPASQPAAVGLDAPGPSDEGPGAPKRRRMRGLFGRRR